MLVLSPPPSLITGASWKPSSRSMSSSVPSPASIFEVIAYCCSSNLLRPSKKLAMLRYVPDRYRIRIGCSYGGNCSCTYGGSCSCTGLSRSITYQSVMASDRTDNRINTWHIIIFLKNKNMKNLIRLQPFDVLQLPIKRLTMCKL